MISYLGFRFLTWIIRLLPFRIIYFLSDILSWKLNYIFQYRKKTMLQNLKQAFPDLKSSDIKTILNKNYKNLADTSLESLKGPTLSREELKKRMSFINPELLPTDRNLILIGGHQGNWEWGGLAVSLWLKQSSVAGVYKPLKNKRINDYFQKSRAKWGLQLLSMRETFGFLRQNMSNTILVLIADQTPSNSKTSYWTTFFNKETPFFNGPEKIAKMKNWPVYFYQVRRAKRGYYEVVFELLCEKPSEAPSGEITTKFKNALEASISKYPQDWLWSHKRWKKEKPAELREFG